MYNIIIGFLIRFFNELFSPKYLSKSRRENLERFFRRVKLSRRYLKYEKLSPELSLVLNKYLDSGEAGVLELKKTFSIVPSWDRSKPARIIFIAYCDKTLDLSGLRVYGIEVNEMIGSIRTGIAPIIEIGRLTRFRGVSRIGLSTTARPKMDEASDYIGIGNMPGNLNGRGEGASDVIIGIIDEGFDTEHKAFKDRIISVWYQKKGLENRKGRKMDGGPGLDYGVEFSNKAGLRPSQKIASVPEDSRGHGTHVTGIAAGSVGPHLGIEPEAKLVLVRTGGDLVNIAHGIQYIFKIADEMELPAVVNISLGHHNHAHDGRDFLASRVNALSGPGRIICACAGNEGDGLIHASVKLETGETGDLDIDTFVDPRKDLYENKSEIHLMGWYPDADEIDVRIKAPNFEETKFYGAGHELPVDPINLQNGIVTISDQIGLNYNPPDERDRLSGRYFFISIEPNADDFVNPGNQVWKLQIKAKASDGAKTEVHLWLFDNDEAIQARFSQESGDNLFTIASPGTSERAITVGSVVTRVLDSSPSTRTGPGMPKTSAILHDTSGLSSQGPLRNVKDFLKPDFCAPGEYICAPRAENSGSQEDERNLWVGNEYILKRGTSMATPIVTGLVARMLRMKPKLTPEQVKDELKNHCQFLRGSDSGKHRWGNGCIKFL